MAARLVKIDVGSKVRCIDPIYNREHFDDRVLTVKSIDKHPHDDTYERCVKFDFCKKLECKPCSVYGNGWNVYEDSFELVEVITEEEIQKAPTINYDTLKDLIP